MAGLNSRRLVDLMRLGILLPPVDSRPAGLGVYVNEIGSRLVRRHRECVVFSGDDTSSPDWAGTLPFVVPERTSSWQQLVRPALPRSARRLHVVNRWLPAELVAHQIDVLFIPFQLALFSSPIPQVVVMHDLRALKLPATSSVLGRAFLSQYLRRALLRTDHVIAVSESTKRDLRELWNLPEENCSVIYEGFSREVYRPASPERMEEATAKYSIARPYVIYVGTYAPHKNLRSALDAFAVARRRRDDLQFVIAGRRDTGSAEEFDRHVERLDVGDAVRQLGYVPAGDMAGLLTGASAFLFPTLYEGFGLAALEAMACGTPVLASNLASLPEVLGPSGRLLEPDDVAGWSDAIIDMVERPTDPDIAGQAAIRQAAKFDWSSAADQILDLITRLHRRRQEH